LYFQRTDTKKTNGPPCAIWPIGCSASRARADEEARRLPWQGLLEARNQYIDWREFYLWFRSILEVEKRMPDWLLEIVNDRCPGFLESEKQLTPQAAKDRPLPFSRKIGFMTTFSALPSRKAGLTPLCFTPSESRAIKAVVTLKGTSMRCIGQV